MIEGIKIEMTTTELKTHVVERVKFHKGKAVWYAKQATNLRAGRSDGMMSASNMTNDPVTSLVRSREEHEKRATYFALVAKHLIPNETYRLSESDLSRLEFASQYFA